ncbi:MAG: ShlB/FhaC/HecB family hemolysin secretion/activation protein [Coleofasciculus sp. S288]|nr:ShlB/FhaC/HecB family hemolysin secretion/activation protein [Coleofasciculus sp. S288]
MRLPSEMPPSVFLQDTQRKYRIQVISSPAALGLTLSIFKCEQDFQACLVGSFSVDSRTSASAREALEKHRAAATPITLTPEIQGYLLEGTKQNPPNQFSSVMWEQDGQLYTVRFRTEQRQNILYMAVSMAKDEPIGGTVAGVSEVAEVDETVAAAPPVFPSSQVVALPDGIFAPYLEQIQRNLPVGWGMRLPSQILVNGTSNVEENQYRVHVSPSTSGTGLTVSLLSCDDPLSCLVGSFSVDTDANPEVQGTFEQHQAAATPITLAEGIRGYHLLERFVPDPPSQFSSVIWKQEGLIYRVRFSTWERQNILYMARSMALQTPIPGIATVAAIPGESSTPNKASQGLLAIALELDSSSQESSSLQAAASTPEDSLPEQCPGLESVAPQPEPPSAEPIRVTDSTVSVQITGSTVFDRDEITDVVKPIVERFVAGDLIRAEFVNELVNRITQLYLENDYLTSRAIAVDLDTPDMTDGVVAIRVIEGRLKEIQIQGRNRLNLSYICSRIKLAIEPPLNTAKLEDQLRLLRVSPHFENVEASLRAAEEQRGESILVVRVTEADPFSFNLSVDNYSPPSVGSERLGVGFRYLNLTGLGDILTGSYRFTTTGGAELFDFTYQIPVNPMEGAFLVRVAPNRNEITQPPFNELGIQGDTELYEVFYRQPLVRTTREELALSVGFTFQEGQTFLFDREPFGFGIGPDEDGVSRTSVFKFSQDYIRRDVRGAWSLRSQFSFGTGLFDATANEGSIPDGQFFSWLGQVQRVQQLSENNFLIIQGDLQLTPNSLLPSQQFVIGGGQSVRGYRQNARTGDNGFRFLIENRITVGRNAAGEPQIQIAPFFDLGAVWNVSGNPNQLPDQRFLVGAGLGLLWNDFANIEGLSLRLDYALPFIDLDDRGNNAQDEGFYFNLNYQQKGYGMGVEQHK